MFTPLRDQMHFCTPGHQTTFNNRMAARGKVIAPLALAWAEGKGGGHRKADPRAMAAMRELTQICREFNDEDKRANRPPAMNYATTLMERGLPVDRRKGREKA